MQAANDQQTQGPPLQTQVQNETEQLLQFFTEYLDLENGPYRARIQELCKLQNQEKRLTIHLNHLREYDRNYWLRVVNKPMECIPSIEMALKNVAITMDQGNRQRLQDEQLQVGFDGAVPQFELNPRTLMAAHLGKLVIMEGIVTRCSLVRPKVRKSVHYCHETQSFYAREYRDATVVGNETATANVYPTDDGEGHALETEFGFCKYYDFQTIAIQEMPERAPTGQIPRSVDVVLNADLVDLVKPGDRVRIYGVYRSLGGLSSNASSSASFRTFLIASSVQPLTKTVYQRAISETDIETIKKVSKKKNVVDLLAKSLAPSIYGNDVIKKAVLLLLLGGMEKNLSNGTHIRGDINILMIGDPSTAKSQMLRFVLKMAPLAVATTGRGSSGVGLTAAVVSDKDTGERRLEAGAMVLADRGIVCIDEFDKMNDIDRVAIHEVMEQQTVTIAKAGIHTTLNARCSVIAAANPIYGQYDNRLSPSANAALPDSLMSRFDLVFVVLDQINASLDRTLSRHVLNMHRYLPPNLEEGDPINELVANMHLQEEEQQEDDSPFEKHHPFVMAQQQQHSRSTSAAPQVLKVSFLKKYIHYAKSRVKPVLTEEASDIIAEKYADFRAKATQISEDRRAKVFPVTPRTLEALIRLSTAHAKARLSLLVEAQDSVAASELINYSIFRELKQPEPPQKKKLRVETEGRQRKGEGSDNDDDVDENNELAEERRHQDEIQRRADALGHQYETRKAAEAQQQQQQQTSQEPIGVASSSIASQGAMSMLIDTTSSVAPTSEHAQSITMTKERYMNFCAQVNHMRIDQGLSSVELQVLKQSISGYSSSEFDAAIQQMQEENKLMVAEATVFFMG